MKKIKFPRSLEIIIILIIFSGALRAFDIKLENMEIISSDTDSVVAIFLARTVHQSQDRFETFFAQKVILPVTIALAKSNAQYREISGFHLPEWSAAVAIPRKRLIVLKPADYFDPDVYSESLLHELAHIYLADKLNENSVPLWLNEGIAMYLSKKSLNWNESTIAGNAVLADNLLSFADIDDLLGFKTGQARIAYIQSFLSVQFFVQQYGEGELKNLIHSAAAGIGIDNYLSQHIGLEYDDLEFITIDWIKDKYWWMIFLQFENMLWIFMLLLVITVIVIIKIRNHRKLSKWENEEVFDAED